MKICLSASYETFYFDNLTFTAKHIGFEIQLIKYWYFSGIFQLFKKYIHYFVN